MANRLHPLACADAIAKTLRLPGHHPPEPKTLQQALAMADVRAWATAYDTELTRHAIDMRTWYIEDKFPSTKPLPCMLTHRAKPKYGGLERHKA